MNGTKLRLLSLSMPHGARLHLNIRRVHLRVKPCNDRTPEPPSASTDMLTTLPAPARLVPSSTPSAISPVPIVRSVTVILKNPMTNGAYAQG